ncbi:MAG TPA: flagellin [Candidatus Binataceae bacterium]|nr:flagellin [Candidatus Binataceae bacterium]
MSLSILNNPASLVAQNELSITSASLQTTLFQLSSGSRINSGADDAAGLAIADGLQANITALTQSARNANDGVGKLQVADGALSQVTSLLNRAITLATESSNGTVSDPQRTAIQAEYSSILAEINRIGSTTTYNGTTIFQNQGDATSATTTLTPTTTLGGIGGFATGTGTGLTTGSALLTSGSPAGETLTVNGNLVYTAGATDTVQNLITAVNSTGQFTATITGGHLVISAIGNTTAPTVAGTLTTDANTAIGTFAGTAGTAKTVTVTSADATRSVTVTDNGGLTVQQLITDIGNANQGFSGELVGGTLVVTDTESTQSPTVAGSATAGGVLGGFSTSTGAAQTAIYLSDSTTAGSSPIDVGIGAISTTSITNGSGGSPVNLSTTSLSTQAAAQSALSSINQAIQNVASTRGTLGAGINRLQSASNVINNQVQNLTTAEDGIRAADIPSTVANLTKFSILEQTGIAALAQANQTQQLVLSLLH